MKLKGAIYCEGPDCSEHARVSADTMELGRLPEGFVKVTRYGDDRDAEHGFCGLDCVMMWCARRSPPETIDGDGWGSEGEVDRER